jgi:hypothetical protein
MTNTQQQPENAEEQRQWLIEYKKSTGLSWSVLAVKTGIPQGTISQFGGKNGYNGDLTGLALKIQRYRDKLVTHHAIRKMVTQAPEYFSTPTSEELTNLLHYAQLGKMAAAAMGAGMSKTSTAKHYQQCYSNVWLATMKPTTATPNTMLVEVLRALGQREATGTPQKLSNEVVAKLKDTNGLLIVDECQHLTTPSFEEIRSWHDQTGIGIALLGNYSMMSRIEGTSRSSDFAQIFSRLGLKKILNTPLPSDALALADAWGFDDEAIRKFIVEISQQPGALRSVTHMIELASMFAAGAKAPLDVSFLKDAWAQLSTRSVMS